MKITKETLEMIREARNAMNQSMKTNIEKGSSYKNAFRHELSSIKMDYNINATDATIEKLELEHDLFNQAYRHDYEGPGHTEEIEEELNENKNTRVQVELIRNARLVNLYDIAKEKFNSRTRWEKILHPFRTHQENKVLKEAEKELNKEHISKAEMDMYRNIFDESRPLPQEINISHGDIEYLNAEFEKNEDIKKIDLGKETEIEEKGELEPFEQPENQLASGKNLSNE